MSGGEIENLQKKLEENISAVAAKNDEIKRLKEEIEKSKDPNSLKQLQEENQRLKNLNEKDLQQIDNLSKIINKFQETLSNQAKEINSLKKEYETLKSQ